MPDAGELMGAALAQRPDYRQAAMEVERLGQSLRAAKSQYLPRVDLFASAGNSAETIGGNNGSDYAFGGSLTVSLFDAGRSPRIRQAAAARDAAMARQEHQADQVRVEVMQAYQQYMAAAARREVASKAVERASEMLRTASDRYGVGLVSITELLRAQTAAFQAKMNRLAAEYDYSVGYAATLLAAGALHDVDAY
jgi:outer membrane protein TolC